MPRFAAVGIGYEFQTYKETIPICVLWGYCSSFYCEAYLSADNEKQETAYGCCSCRRESKAGQYRYL